MDYKEAIKNEEIELNELKTRLMDHERMFELEEDDQFLKTKTYHKNQIYMLKILIEQKSIVLESAKLLHNPFRMIYSWDKHLSENNIESIRLLDVNNEPIGFIKHEEAEDIGIRRFD